MLALCRKSLLNRGFVAAMTVVSIALSVALILGVERLRTEARAGFANSAKSPESEENLRSFRFFSKNNKSTNKDWYMNQTRQGNLLSRC